LAQAAEGTAREIRGEQPYQMLSFGRCHKPYIWTEWWKLPFGRRGILKSFKNEELGKGGLGFWGGLACSAWNKAVPQNPIEQTEHDNIGLSR
jgi:hypothetical protein